MSVKDDLAGVLADSLNKKFKDYKVAYFLDGTDNTPTDVKEFVSTGSTMLDLAISNRPNGGIAVGRITELNGLESSGKSLIGAHLLAETQKKGGVAVYIDTETAVSEDFLGVIGVDINKMLYLHLETVEDIFEAIEEIVTKVRESDKDRLVTILVDSLAAATTKVELNADYDKDGWATSKAIVISKAMRKITQMIGRQRVALVFTNQLRVKLGAMFGDPYTTSGGKAIPFHASVRLRLKSVGQIKVKKDGVDQAIGIKTRCQVVKNRMGPPLKTIDYDIYFESGIDNYGGWLNVMKQFKLVGTAGAWYTFKRADGTDVKFLSKDFEKKLDELDGLKDEIYNAICEAYILKYKPGEDIGIDDVEIDEEGGEL